jgi:putative transcriptional regulator
MIGVVSVAGKLLVALPAIVEDTFRRTVVLVLEHRPDTAYGVVINRPTDIPLAVALPRWDERAAAPAVVFQGGPVEQDSAIALGRDGDAVAPIDLEGDPALLGSSDVRVFAGYAGWSAGQLDDELVRGAWAVCDAEPGDAFRADADGLWYSVLARQPEPLRRLAMLPDDLSVN